MNAIRRWLAPEDNNPATAQRHENVVAWASADPRIGPMHRSPWYRTFRGEKVGILSSVARRTSVSLAMLLAFVLALVATETRTLAAAPQITPEAARPISSTSELMLGFVNPEGLNTNVYVQVGWTTAYEFGASSGLDIADGTSATEAGGSISGLVAQTTYHFRIYATNSSGTTYGPDQTFTTLPSVSATTSAASSVTATSVVLNGSAGASGVDTSAHFDFGTSSSYGRQTTFQDIGSDVTPVSFNATVTGLQPATTYHFRISASNTNGSALGNDMVFTTLAAPEIVAGNASAVSATGATFNGSVNPNGVDTSVYFQYGADTGYGTQTTTQDIGAGTGFVSVSGNAAALTAGATYHFRLVTTGAAGTFYGPDQSFETRPTNPESSAVIAGGTPVPGAGTGTIPVGANWYSFASPAIDDGGNVAFLGRWKTTVPNKVGTPGVFLGNTLLAQVGGETPDITGVKFKQLSAPVIDSGKVAWIATLSGTGITTKNAQSIYSTAFSGSPAKVVQANDLAGGTGGAHFQSFTQVAVSGSSVAFLARLAPQAHGQTVVTSANSVGLWSADSGNGTTLLLRQGDEIGGKKIKTLVSFLVGNGSPGQGRGWIRKEGVITQALALVIFTDKSQAVVSADSTGPVQILSQTNVAGQNGSPEISSATFKSYGVPAADANGGSAFLATLTSGEGGVTTAAARGVFIHDSGSGQYELIAQATGTAPGITGGTFSLLKDVALASDGTSLAFPATIKGKGISGPKASTLWWKQPGQNLTLLAGGGTTTPVPDIPSAQWKSFASLGVVGGYGNGPIFSARLIPGPAKVTAANAQGIWGMTSAGTLRLLLRSGVTTVGAKTVKSFTFLTATPGSQGVSRWFNDNGQIVCVATFADKSQGLVLIQAP